MQTVFSLHISHKQNHQTINTKTIFLDRSGRITYGLLKWQTANNCFEYYHIYLNSTHP